jgi:hypothetical protein
LELSDQSFTGCVAEQTDSKAVDALRDEHAKEWFLYWRGGRVLGLPLVESPKRQPGARHVYNTSDLDTLHVVAGRIGDVLPSLFPDYPPYRRRRRSFSFLARKQEMEIVGRVTNGWRDLPALVKLFSIKPRFNLEPKIIEDREGETTLGLFVDIETRWQIRAPVDELSAAGIDLSGLAVIRRSPVPGQKALVGTIRAVAGGHVELEESFDDTRSVPTEDVWVEGSRSAFSRSLRHLLGERQYDRFEVARQREEGKLFLGADLDKLITEMGKFLWKKDLIPLAHGLSCRVLDRIELTNTPDFQSVRFAGDVEHCYDAAKTKRHVWAWPGLLRFGPFDRDIFTKRSPRILVITPDKIAGRVSTFIGHFKNGIPSASASTYQKGFAATFGLANPTFTPVSVQLLGLSEEQVAPAYRRTIEEHLATTEASYDAAFVVLQDAQARLPDAINPYLHAKATLLMHGIVSQQSRFSTISAAESDLQWKLPNIATAMYAKLGGTPWTVAQAQNADDEIVVGMGMAELSNSRFEERHRYTGITTVFRGDGNYLLSNVSRVCNYAQYPEVLRTTITSLLEDLRERNGWRPGHTVRVVFHARKPLKNVEVAQIVRDCVTKVGQGLNIEFAFLTIETSHSFKLFDSEQQGHEKRPGQGRKGVFAPARGTIAQLGRYTRLLTTNGPHQLKRPASPLPSPLLIHLHRESQYRDLDYLAEQVLKFTSLTWRSTLPAYAPVTIYYSELIADLLARLPAVGDWSPATLNTKLRFNRWFL